MAEPLLTTEKEKAAFGWLSFLRKKLQLLQNGDSRPKLAEWQIEPCGQETLLLYALFFEKYRQEVLCYMLCS